MSLKHTAAPEEFARYRAHCDNVGRKLYSYGGHLIRWEENTEEVRQKYRHMAHMARVWWNLETGAAKSESTNEQPS